MPPLSTEMLGTGYQSYPAGVSEPNFSLWMVNISVAVFIGIYGEARVGSGCDKSQEPSEQAVIANCSADHGERTCRFYTGSNGIRRYLAMRDSGALETLAVPEKRWASALEEFRAPPTRNRPRIETLFSVAPHFDCKGNTECETVSLSSVSTEKHMYVRIEGNPHHKNLTKLHHKALTLKSEMGRKYMCLKNPGPFHQRPTINSDEASPFRLMLTHNQTLQCSRVPFTESSCRTGSLRASYPIQNPVRAGSKSK